ncbi:MAG: 50S ribosomal protein L29 [Candidatus Neomarinimicrobiota bacterium]
MKREELRQISEDELRSRLVQDLEELENLRFQKALQQLENPLRIRHLRREIAQIKTILREIQLSIRQPGGGE